jgi:hypothetical protein
MNPGIEADFSPPYCIYVKPLMLELNPSTQRRLTRFFTGDFNF